MNWKSFVIGIMCGVIISLALVYFMGSRYSVSSEGPQRIMIFKVDKWTGRSWMARYYEQGGSKVWYWEEMKEK